MAIKKDVGKSVRNDKFRVVFTGLVANTFFIASGCNLSYVSPAVPDINNNRNAFHVDDNEQSWIGSLSLLGYALGAVVCGSISDCFGRKLTMMASAALCIIGFTIVSSATNVQTMYVGLIITGVFRAINNTAIILYTSEIATPDNRGMLLSLLGTLSNAGTVIVFVAGSYLPWNWLATFTAAMYAYPPLILVFLPESPRWFLLKGDRDAAAHGLRWFRGKYINVDTELEVVRQSLVGASKGIAAFKDLFKWKHAKSLFTCFVLFVIQSFCGRYVILVFTVTIFQLTKVDINSNLQSVIMGFFTFLGSVLCLFLIEHCGRRPLLIYSTAFTVLGNSMVAAFFQVQYVNPEYATEYLFWLPMFGLSLGSFMYSIGLGTIPWVFSCELFPTNVRGTVQTVNSVMSTLAQFTAVKTFTNIESVIDTSGAFWFYTACGAAGIAFIVSTVKEPKPKILD